MGSFIYLTTYKAAVLQFPFVVLESSKQRKVAIRW